MIPVEIDPSEVRQPRQDSPERTGPRFGRPAMLAGLAVIGIGGCAGLAAAAYPTLSDLLRPRPTEVHFGRVADMPEIKDGIPALRTSPAPVVRQVAIPPAAPPAAPAALLDPKPAVAPAPSVPAAGLQAGMQSMTAPGAWSPTSDVAATGTAGSFQPIPAAVPKAPVTPRPVAATPREDVKPRESVKPSEVAKPRQTAAAPREAMPMPPARAVQTKLSQEKPPAPREKVAEEKASKPAPAREAKHEAGKDAGKPAAPKQTAERTTAEKPVARRDKPEAHQRTAAAQPVPVPQAEEPTRFLGVPMPDLAPAGRAIKDTVDAVISFPSRL